MPLNRVQIFRIDYLVENMNSDDPPKYPPKEFCARDLEMSNVSRIIIDGQQIWPAEKETE
jgi:hypothetical protein